jgi:hypothetical protein
VGIRKRTPNDHRVQGTVAYIGLSNAAGEVYAEALIDAADLPQVLSHPYRWFATWHANSQTYRVQSHAGSSGGKQRSISLPRFLLQPLPGFVVDHINHNALDNRRCNLRVVTQSENVRNFRPGAYANGRGPRAGRQPGAGPTLVPGIPTERQIEFVKSKQRWRARLVVAGVRRSCGTHRTREAAIARVEAERDKLRQ